MALVPALTIFVPGTVIVASQVNSNFAALRNIINGQLDDANIQSLSMSKISGTLPPGQLPAEVVQDKGALGTTNLGTLGPDDVGLWYQENDGTATSGRQYPVTTAGALLVLPSAFGAQQVYFPRNSPLIWVRSLTSAWNGTNGPWGSWGTTNDASQLTQGTLPSARIGSGAINASRLGTDAVTTSKIQDGAVTTAKLANTDALSVLGRSVNSSGAVAPISAVANNYVLMRTADQLTFGLIQGSNIGPNEIGDSHISSVAASKLTGFIQQVNIQNGSVTRNKLSSGAGLSVIGRSSDVMGSVSDISASSDGFVLRRAGNTLGFGLVGTGNIDDGAVTATKLRNSAGLSVMGRSVSTAGPPGDIVAGTDGHVLRRVGSAVAFGTVGASGLGSNSVTTDKIMNGAVETAKIATGAINSARLGELAVISSKIADGAVTTDKINDYSVTNVKLGSNSVQNSNIVDGTINRIKLDDLATRTVMGNASDNVEQYPKELPINHHPLDGIAPGQGMLDTGEDTDNAIGSLRAIQVNGAGSAPYYVTDPYVISVNSSGDVTQGSKQLLGTWQVLNDTSTSGGWALAVRTA